MTQFIQYVIKDIENVSEVYVFLFIIMLVV